jgi:membrane protein implicated in regulation of membrane protease activity
MAVRDFQFYSELVLVTVLSIFAANMWVRWMSQTLTQYFPGNLHVDLVVAIVSTAVAILILYYMFSDREKGIEKVKEEKDELQRLLRRASG